MKILRSTRAQNFNRTAVKQKILNNKQLNELLLVIAVCYKAKLKQVLPE